MQPCTDDVELVYLAKPDHGNYPQHNRYHAVAIRLAAQVQDIGLRWQSKWTAGEDHILAEVLTQTLFAREDAFRSSYTTLMVNSGYARALRLVLVRQLAEPDAYEDVTIARALIRLLGKVAAGERDARALLHVINSAGLDIDTRVGTLLDDHTVAPTARRECAWWLSLPQGVLTSTRTNR